MTQQSRDTFKTQASTFLKQIKIVLGKNVDVYSTPNLFELLWPRNQAGSFGGNDIPVILPGFQHSSWVKHKIKIAF